MNNVKSVMKTIISMLVIVLAMGSLVMGLIILAYCLPLNRANFIESKEVLLSEGARPDVLEQNKGDWSNAYGFEPGIVNTTNEIANLDRAGGTEGMSPVYNAIAMEAPDWGQYPRYWHGHCALMRVLLLAFDIKEMRFLFFLIHLILVFILSSIAFKEKGWIPALIIILQYILMMPLAVCAFFDFSVCYTVGLLLTLFSYLWIKKDVSCRISNKSICLLFCLIGGIVDVVDKYSITMVTWTLPILIIVLFFGERRTTLDNAITVVVSGLGWIFGYAGLCIFKLSVATVYLKTNVLLDGWQEAGMWVEKTEDSFSPSRFLSIFLNYKHYTYKLFEIILLFWMLYALVMYVMRSFKNDPRTFPSLIIAFGPLVYQFVMHNSVYHHHVFTYRMLSGTIVAVLFILYYSIGKENAVRPLKLAGITVLFVMCCGLTFFLREDYSFNNAGNTGHYLEFDEENPVMEMDFSPRYREVTEFSIGLDAPSENGYFDCTIYDGDKAVYNFSIMASDVIQDNWQVLKTDWRLEKDKSYKLAIRAIGTEKGSAIYVLDDPAYTLNDLRGLTSNGIPASSQPVTWVRYSGLYQTRHYIFYSMSWLSFIIAVICSFKCLSKEIKEKCRDHQLQQN